LRRDLWLREFGTVRFGGKGRVRADGDDGVVRADVGSVEALESDDLSGPRSGMSKLHKFFRLSTHLASAATTRSAAAA
jgi:hypothetical protein